MQASHQILHAAIRPRCVSKLALFSRRLCYQESAWLRPGHLLGGVKSTELNPSRSPKEHPVIYLAAAGRPICAVCIRNGCWDALCNFVACRYYEFFFLFLVYQEFRWRVGNTNSAGCLCQVDLVQQKLVLNVFHGQLCSPSEEDLRGKSLHERGKNKDNQA